MEVRQVCSKPARLWYPADGESDRPASALATGPEGRRYSL
jgi:hypothetical protein